MIGRFHLKYLDKILINIYISVAGESDLQCKFLPGLWDSYLVAGSKLQCRCKLDKYFHIRHKSQIFSRRTFKKLNVLMELLVPWLSTCMSHEDVDDNWMHCLLRLRFHFISFA